MSIAEKLTTIAEKQQAVYDAGYTAGQAVGGDTEAAYNNGIADGQQAEYDRFWDNYQRKGQPASYGYAFAGNGWTEQLFRPKYNIYATNMSYIFRSSYIRDLKGILEQSGLKIICSSGSVEYFAMGSALTRVPEMNVTLTVFTNAFNGCTSLVSVDKLQFSTSTSCSCSNAFRNCTALTEIRFNSGIRPTNLSFAQSALMSRDSFSSNNEDGKGYGLIPALSEDVSGSVTVSEAAVNAAFTEDEWQALTDTRLNWTISLS